MACSWDVEESAEMKRNGALSISTLRDVFKMEGDRMKEFVGKYRELKVQASRERAINTQYNGTFRFMWLVYNVFNNKTKPLY